MTLNHDRIALNFFKHLDFNKIQDPKLIEYEFDFDVFYRVYHHSFKMYRLKDMAINEIKQMFNPLGVTDFSDIKKLLRSWNLHEIFRKSFETINNMKFDMSKNDPEIWFNEATALMGCFMNIATVSYSTRKTLFEIRENYCNSFIYEGGVLTSHEAMFLEAWSSIGSTIRYQNKVDVTKKIKKIIEAKLDKLPLILKV